MELWQTNRCTLVTSDHIIREVIRTLGNQYFYDRGVRAFDIAKAELRLRQESIVVEPIHHIAGLATHPEDDVILATALSGDADYVITHDKQLLRLQRFQDIEIVRPGVIVGLLQGGS